MDLERLAQVTRGEWIEVRGLSGGALVTSSLRLAQVTGGEWNEVRAFLVGLWLQVACVWPR